MNEPSTNTLELKLAPQKADAIHRALLSGLLSNIATRTDAHEYTAARNVKTNIHPGSGLFKRRPGWIMAAELVETTRLYARTVAPIQPQWVEKLASHLVQRTYSEPHWQPQTAHVSAFERVTLWGLVLTARRSVHYGPIDPEVSRQLFIYHALVLGEYRSGGEFFAHNRRLIEEIRTLEAKQRQRDLLVSDQAIYDFFDKRIPPGIYNGPLFEKWRQHTERGRPTLLFLHRRDLLAHEVTENKADYPDTIEVPGLTVPVQYVFDPGDPNDGVTVTIPLAALNQVPAERFEWLVPGLLREKVIALMKSMPKALRVRFVPVPEHADRAIAALRLSAPSLLNELAYALGKMIGEPMDRNAFAPQDIDPYLRTNFRIVDDNGEEVLVSRDLDAIRRRLGIEARKTFQHQPPSEFHRDSVTSWDFGDLPDRVEVRKNAMTLQGYPAIVDAAGKSVSLRLFDAPELARQETRRGVRRLLMLQLREEVKWLSRKLPGFEQMQMNYATVGSADDLKADLVEAIIDRALFSGGGHAAPDVRTRQQFLDRAQLAWKRMNVAANEIGGLVSQILEKYQALNFELSKVAPPALIGSYQDMRRHLAGLVYNGFITQTSPAWLEQYPRFLTAIEIRLRKLLNAGLNRDQSAMAEIAPLLRQYQDRRDANARDQVADPELETYGWMLEELRVQSFAQELKTSIPVSIKRLEAQWAKVRKPANPSSR